jgi:hypothetical protein
MSVDMMVTLFFFPIRVSEFLEKQTAIFHTKLTARGPGKIFLL